MFFLVFAISATAFCVFADDEISVTVDGESVVFDQSPIAVDGRTLVPIRAVCEKIGAAVAWDNSSKTVTISYNDTILALTIGKSQMTINGESTVYLDVPPAVYSDRTLLPIRAVAENLGCDIDWDSKENHITITNVHSILVPEVRPTAGYVGNWGSVSSVQQFLYKNEGMAYAYTKDGKLEIALPGGNLTVNMQYPKLGDIISDDDGNIYVVYGKDNETNDFTVQTIFISKYSPTGSLIKTTGFVGESIMGDTGNTKTPFHAGLCVSAIGNGVLMVNYARTMYNGHQSNNVIGVNIANMSPVGFDSVREIPYTSHSFNQSILYGKNIGFVYADHGDAYDRGFVITTDAMTSDAMTTGAGIEKIPFHFYLEANANYNMSIVNRTFAQLGGLAETSKGIALVGASAKSISEAAKSEKQNLFVQILNPNANGLNPSAFVGGTNRSGATSNDIRDNSGKPLVSVTDYGVHWLTNYSDVDAIAPQVVSAEDNLVILWATTDDTFYTVLDADGDVLIPATSLHGIPLNAYERPIYHKGAVYWAAVTDSQFSGNRLAVRKIDLN
jgi:hypothetical protein